MWADRFDRIIASNKSQLALRLNRSQRSIEAHTSNRSKLGDTLNMNSTVNQMVPVVPLGVDLVSQDTMSAHQLNSYRAHGTAKFSKTMMTQYELVDTRREGARNASVREQLTLQDQKHKNNGAASDRKPQLEQSSNHLGDTMPG